MSMKPINGGDAPLYNPKADSRRIVCLRQSSVDENLVEVCKRTLSVSINNRDLIDLV